MDKTVNPTHKKPSSFRSPVKVHTIYFGKYTNNFYGSNIYADKI